MRRTEPRSSAKNLGTRGLSEYSKIVKILSGRYVIGFF